MILGTQWYILFNVIAGASASRPTCATSAAISACAAGCGGGSDPLPAIFPYYVTGAITASGGSWNASIVAEVASWGDSTLQAHGLGAYIAQATEAGDFPPHRARHRGDEPLRRRFNRAVLAAALPLRRTQVPNWLEVKDEQRASRHPCAAPDLSARRTAASCWCSTASSCS